MYIAHEQLLFYPEKELKKVSFSEFFMQTATKHEQETQHIASQIIPIAISNIPPENRLFQTRYFWYFVNCAERIFRSIMEVRTKRVRSFAVP